jgi:hypothetical protein
MGSRRLQGPIQRITRTRRIVGTRHRIPAPITVTRTARSAASTGGGRALATRTAGLTRRSPRRPAGRQRGPPRRSGGRHSGLGPFRLSDRRCGMARQPDRTVPRSLGPPARRRIRLLEQADRRHRRVRQHQRALAAKARCRRHLSPGERHTQPHHDSSSEQKPWLLDGEEMLDGAARPKARCCRQRRQRYERRNDRTAAQQGGKHAQEPAGYASGSTERRTCGGALCASTSSTSEWRGDIGRCRSGSDPKGLRPRRETGGICLRRGTGGFRTRRRSGGIRAARGIHAGSGIRAARGIHAGRSVHAGRSSHAGGGTRARSRFPAGRDAATGNGTRAGRGTLAGRDADSGGGIPACDATRAGSGILAGQEVHAGNGTRAGSGILAGADIHAGA